MTRVEGVSLFWAFVVIIGPYDTPVTLIIIHKASSDAGLPTNDGTTLGQHRRRWSDVAPSPLPLRPHSISDDVQAWTSKSSACNITLGRGGKCSRGGVPRSAHNGQGTCGHSELDKAVSQLTHDATKVTTER